MSLRHAFLAGLSFVALATGASAAEPRQFDAVLSHHAVLPAQSFAVPPADAPAALNTSGRYTGTGAASIRSTMPIPALPVPSPGSRFRASPASARSATAPTSS